MAELEVTADEKDFIKQLRDRVSDVLPSESDDDIYLRKWLRAREFDLDKAEVMLRKHIKFMKINDMEKIEQDFLLNEAVDYFHTAKIGYDSEGSVVRIAHLGASDLRGLALSVSRRDAVRFLNYILFSDRQEQKRDRQGQVLCDKQVYIADLEGLSWMSVIHRTVGERVYFLLKSYEAHQPESLKVAYVLHAPAFFNFIYSWVKTILPESILSKLQLVPNDMIQSVLTKNIDPSILPASMGGTRTDEDGDPYCPSLYKKPLNALVPESMKLCQQLKLLENDPDVKKVTVECGCIWRVRAHVTQSNSTLQWDFQTAYYDICFGLSFQRDENAECTPIISPHRVESHVCPESGNFTCFNPGLYELVFDNTYSWMTKKELLYKVKVVPPSENLFS